MARNLFLVSASVLTLSATAALADSNRVYLDQSGTSQSATIDQSSSGNVVGFSQINGDGNGGNLLAVTQTGANNLVGVNQPGFQSGTANTANIRQDGHDSSVDLQQTGTANGVQAFGWTNGSIFNGIRQDSTAAGSSVSLVQNGANNVFDIAQGGAGNRTSATQAGANGFLYVRQGTTIADTNYPPTNGYASSFASNSAIDVTQVTTAGYNYAAAAQGGGNGNGINIYQNGSLLGAGVNQNGNGNTFASIQSGSNNQVGTDSFDDPVIQKGDGNQYYNTQVGSNGIALGSQVGTGNLVSTYQSGDTNKITGTQNGNSNNVQSGQSGNNDTLTYTQINGNYNYVLNSQFGNGATATITQKNGDGNQALNYQDSTKATLTATSDGYSNYIYNSQSGVADATISQLGNGNISSGSQAGGAGGNGNSVTINQGKSGVAYGTGNQAYYAQNGTNLALNVTQLNSGNYSNTSQSGNGSIATIIQH